jgi:ferritin
MKISGKIQDAVNGHINAELYSAYIYLSMSAYSESANLPGFGHWMRKQAQEEVGHAMKLYNHIIDRGGVVSLAAVDKPPAAWKNPLAVFEAAYEHEKKVTAMIGKLVDLARKEDDKATESFLKWFIDEQVEEENQTLKIVETLKQLGDSKMGLIMLDKELAKRE